MAVVEQAQGEDREIASAGQLHYRLRQQSVLAAFGIEALRARDLDPMLQRATELCAEGMRSSFCKFLEYKADRETLLVRTGVGWGAGVVGSTEMRTDMGSPAGFALQTGQGVISNHLDQEERFRTPQFMADHRIRRAINVLVEASGQRYGVLEVDSPDEGRFEEADLAFMQGFANLIGVAIERQEAERRLAEAVEHQQLLTREASHRVKNSLALVSAMLNLQKQEDDDPRVLRMLNDAQARIAAIAQTHDRLWRSERVGMVSLDDLACGIADQLAQQAKDHEVHCDIEAIEMNADTAIPIGLMLTELLTNAIKYAYGEEGGVIDVGLHARDGQIVLSVRDKGKGLPADFDMKAASRLSLGMRMITSLARQLRGEVRFDDAAPGTCATLTMPDPRD
ncbi:sensor histidine kinase [Sphingomonas parapaucimobilis]|uniref:histidine kinase n=1 Tax=Sphingomonas parapaucimobilis NBRC 15100 TaxID=1219049 RepID=A0A0A1W2G8_9SPHN|nr:histidine kinase dimerization/phosphoacceptor domain -containing protein [Sphingomonas parapaucimobilis]GAL99386.1 putative two-component histidine kinase [Sphingomonas parapaucimobilis NBRC 15100]